MNRILLGGLGNGCRRVRVSAAAGLATLSGLAGFAAVDPGFAPELIAWGQRAETIVFYPMSDGRLMTLGEFTHAGTRRASGVARLTAAGAHDPSFHFLAGSDVPTDRILPLIDGRALLFQERGALSRST